MGCGSTKMDRGGYLHSPSRMEITPSLPQTISFERERARSQLKLESEYQTFLNELESYIRTDRFKREFIKNPLLPAPIKIKSVNMENAKRFNERNRENMIIKLAKFWYVVIRTDPPFN